MWIQRITKREMQNTAMLEVNQTDACRMYDLHKASAKTKTNGERKLQTIAKSAIPKR